MTRRNEKTGRFESVPAEEITEQPSYGYYSKVLNKPFDTLQELQEAELEVKRQEEAKKNALACKKQDVEVVKSAIAKRIETDIQAKKEAAKAYEEYLAKLDEIKNSQAEAKKAERDALNEFCSKYKEGFHDTITVDDIQYKFDYSTSGNVSFTDPLDRLLTSFFGRF